MAQERHTTRPTLEADFERYVRSEGNRALSVGSLFAAALAGIGVVAIPTGIARGAISLSTWIFSLVCVLQALVIHALARRERLAGAVGYVVLLGSALLPNAFFALLHFTEPGGAAAALNGPSSWVNPFLVVVTGFLFDPRLSVLASVLAGSAYFGCAMLELGRLASLRTAAPLAGAELGTWQFYAMKAVIIMMTGVAVAASNAMARRLMRRAVDEERQRASVDRLLGEYVSEEVKEQLLRDPAAQRGERKEVVVLFSDLRGFTAMSETVPPEQLVARLNVYLDAMVAAIASNGGVVDKFIGDAVMAVFGGIVPLPSPHAAALDAAIEMRKRLAALNAEWRKQGVEPLDNGIGLHAGEVLMGAIGNARRKNFTVIGDVVNTAARVETLTRQLPEAILITGAVWRRLGERHRDACVERGSHKVKGRTAEVEIYGVPD